MRTLYWALMRSRLVYCSGISAEAAACDAASVSGGMAAPEVEFVD